MDAHIAQAYGDIAAGSLAYPLMPQLLRTDELLDLAGALQGWEILGDHIDPALKAWSATYGGGVVDGALKLKLQSWLRGWVKPPSHYLIHHPRMASGLWIRLYRTGMRIAEHTEQLVRDLADLEEAEVVARYEHHLGIGSRERYAEFRAWLADTKVCIEQGEWHLAYYSPKWEAFISPLQDAEAGTHLVKRTLSEFPPVSVQLYPSSVQSSSSWNLADAIRCGAYVELYGDRLDAPPFGTWGEGVRLADGARLVSGLIHSRPDRIQVAALRPGAHGSVLADFPALPTILQDLYAVTGWRGGELFTREALTAPNLDLLWAEVLSVTEQGTKLLPIPGEVLADSMVVNPNFTPVYGRLVSTLPHVDLERSHTA